MLFPDSQAQARLRRNGSQPAHLGHRRNSDHPVVLNGHQASVNALASVQGALFSAGTDGTIRRWALRAAGPGGCLPGCRTQLLAMNGRSVSRPGVPGDLPRLPDLCTAVSPKR